MHDVDRGLAVLDQLLDGLVHRGVDVVETQRNRADGARNVGAGPAGAVGQVLLQPRGVSQRGAHQQELGVGEFQEGHLPGPATVGLGVVVELIHDHLVDLRILAVAQRDIGENLGGGADNGGTTIDGRITGHHAHILRAKGSAEVEELLADQSLDRGGVETALPARQRHEVGRQGHHGLPGPRGGRQDDVVLGDQRRGCLLLRLVEADPAVFRPPQEGRQHGVVNEPFRDLVEVGE